MFNGYSTIIATSGANSTKIRVSDAKQWAAAIMLNVNEVEYKSI